MSAKTPQGPQLGGLDCDFVNEPPDSFKCLICTLVVKEPWQHGECGRVYCRVCIEEYRKVKNICPNCRQKKPHFFRDGRSEKDVRDLMVRCSNRCLEDSDTCKWTGELRNLDDHRLTCPFEPLPCPCKCMKNGQDVKVLRKYIQRHLDMECTNRPHTCPYCNKEGTYSDIVTTHLETCTKAPILCPNTPCNTVIVRERMKGHVDSECLYVTTVCPYSDIGCSAKVQRKNLEKHAADMPLHVKTASETITALRKNITELKADMKKLELKMKREISEKAHLMRNGQTMFKMTNFSTYRYNGGEFQSPPFYTGQKGYKICVIVEANNSVKIKGGYISIYAHLMKGEYDDNLPWPLVGMVTFELLNQLGNHNHRKKSCNFPADDKDNRRVIDQEIARAGYGCPKFISHVKLGVEGTQEGSKDVQYLKDDTLFFRVSVQAPDPIDHDWLKCY